MAGKSHATPTSTLHEDLLMWLARHNLPFSTADTKAFRELFSHQLPNINLPSSDSLRLTTLPKLYTCMKTKVMDCLLSEKLALCLMFDSWTDELNAQHFLGIRAAITGRRRL